MKRRGGMWLCGLLLGLAAPADAGWRATLQTQTDSGVDIDLTSPIDNAPRDGYAPCWVTIRNHSGAAHTWTIRADSRNVLGGSPNEIASSQTLRVEADASARIAVLMPLLPLSAGATYYGTRTIRVEGYGLDETAAAGIPHANFSGKAPTPFIGMGDELAVPLWEPLKKAYDDRGSDLAGSAVDVSQLGTDWRALAGFDCLWLTDTEYAGLEAPQQAAVRQWIEQGGTFYLCTQALDPALRAGLGLAASDTEATMGFGVVKLVPWDGKTLAQADAIARIDAVPALRQADSTSDATHWAMVKAVGVIPLNIPFLIGFIAVFATLVGPVNLFWLARATRRHRLFWTTPLISLAASLLLIVVILALDGFGGHGERVMVTLLCPGQKQAVVVQEQVARTGVLLSRGFTVAEDLMLVPVKVGRFTGLSFGQAGRDYRGDWFASRRVQAQRAEAIVPSRAEIQLLNADAANAGAPPVVASSLPAALQEIRYCAPSGRRWRGGRLRTGERITLQPDPSPDGHADARGSEMLSAWQQQLRDRPGCFFAVAEDAPFIDTLPSIRWEKQHAVFVGPVTSAP